MMKKIAAAPVSRLAKFTPEEVKNIVTNLIDFENSPKSVMERLKEFTDKNPVFSHIKKENEEEFKDIVTQTLTISNFKKHYALARATGSKMYQTMALQMADELIQEFNCEKTSEKALVHIIVNAYIRTMEFSERLNDGLHQDYLSNEKTSYFAMIGKEVERAERQYIMAMNSLVQMKQPPMKLNIKTNTAYIADKQQINMNDQTHEKIKPI